MLVCQYTGKPFVFVGATDAQVTYAGNSDPRNFFTEGEIVFCVYEEIHAWKTEITLLGYPNNTFNSVCFKEKVE